jgi:epoxyqueuosine reductase
MSNDISRRQESLVRTLKENGASLVGFGDVSVVGSELTQEFPVAISLGLKYDEKIVDNLHTEEDAFHKHLTGLNSPMKRLLSITENLLAEWGYKHVVTPISVLVESNKQLQELHTFPHKTAATCAGLGWIGKPSLLVTPEYGPRIRLGTVLTKARFATAEPIVRSQCGECSPCIEACPYGAIYNVNWERGKERDDLFDAYLCNEKRLEYISVIGRKHSCGLCLQACRIGRELQNQP